MEIFNYTLYPQSLNHHPGKIKIPLRDISLIVFSMLLSIDHKSWKQVWSAVIVADCESADYALTSAALGKQPVAFGALEISNTNDPITKEVMASYDFFNCRGQGNYWI